MPEPDNLQWRSDLGWDPSSPADPADPKDGLVIHYDSADQGLADQSHSACEAYWQRTRDFHTGPSRGWVDIRSEERRVGRECRASGGRYDWTERRVIVGRE